MAAKLGFIVGLGFPPLTVPHVHVADLGPLFTRTGVMCQSYRLATMPVWSRFPTARAHSAGWRVSGHRIDRR
jgi:hypothetical protein